MTDPIAAYKQSHIKTAKPKYIIVMLYREAIRQMDIAITALEEKNVHQFDVIHNAITKTQDIVTELLVALDYNKGKEIAENLQKLYLFFHKELMEANIQKDATRITPIKKMMQDLLSAWESAASSSSEDGKVINEGMHFAK